VTGGQALAGLGRTRGGKRGIRTSALLVVPMLAVTIFGKLGVPPLSQQSLGFGLYLLIVCLAFAVVFDQVVIKTKDLLIFGVLATYIVATQLFVALDTSISSVILLLTLFGLHCFRLRPTTDDSRSIESASKYFSALCYFIAWCGIGQVVGQAVLPAEILFPIENFAPEPFVLQGFNMQAPIAYGATLYRANGMFMLEPSFFSQLMALGLILEASTAFRLRRMLVLSVALLLSYSGTGVLVLLFAAPVLLPRLNRRHLLQICVAAVIIFLAASSFVDTSVLASRATEFESTESSGYARFVGGFDVLSEFVFRDPVKALFGVGAGQYASYLRLSTTPSAEMALFKLLLEYGVVGFALLTTYLVTVLYRRSLPPALSTGLFVVLFMNGALIPFFHGLALALACWPASDT
jgi:hypothetical protein